MILPTTRNSTMLLEERDQLNPLKKEEMMRVSKEQPLPIPNCIALVMHLARWKLL
jgi:hypothetical protein